MVAKRRRERMIDFAIYIGVGLAVAATVVVGAIYQDQLGLAHSDTSRWPGTILVTFLVFPTLIRQNWALRKARGFWPVVGLLLMAHPFVVALVWWVDDLWFKGGLGKLLWGASWWANWRSVKPCCGVYGSGAARRSPSGSFESC